MSAVNDSYLLDTSVSNVLLVGGYNVYPIAVGGIFEGQESTFTNQSSTWFATVTEELDGAFTFSDGGSFTFTKGIQAGTASFDYTVFNYDGLGNDATGSWSVIVQ